MKTFAQLYNQISTRERVLVLRPLDDPERELVIVVTSRIELVVRYYHECPGSAHQAPKSTSVKFIRVFWWPDLKCDVHLYIACCFVCERFLRLHRTP